MLGQVGVNQNLSRQVAIGSRKLEIEFHGYGGEKVRWPVGVTEFLLRFARASSTEASFRSIFNAVYIGPCNQRMSQHAAYLPAFTIGSFGNRGHRL